MLFQYSVFVSTSETILFYASEANIVNKGTPIYNDMFQLHQPLVTLVISLESFSFTFEIVT